MVYYSAVCVPMEEKIAIVGRYRSSHPVEKIGIDMFPFNKDEMILPISSSVKTVNSGGEVVDQALLTPVQIVDISFAVAKHWARRNKRQNGK